jgi:hypothetical protein
MKKTLALLLCLAMLFTALSVNVFAAEEPAVTIVTHGTAVSGETDFAINLNGFESLKGYDLVIEAGAGLELVSASALNAKTELTEDVNYTIVDNKLHIVELTKALTGDIITVSAKFAEGATAPAEVKVTACDLAKSGTELYAAATIAPATIAPYVAPKKEVVEEAKEVAQPAGTDYFIPYGSVYAGDKYVAKDENGKFNVEAGTNVDTFKVPANGFGTFGVSDSAVAAKPAKQFGNVDMNYSAAKKYGTLIIVGAWADFRDYYLSNKAYSDTALIEKIYAAYNTANPEGKYDFVSFKAGDASIKVYNVAQKNWMWKSATALEYAVRVYGLVDGAEYAAAAYNVENSAVTFAKEIKAVTYNK